LRELYIGLLLFNFKGCVMEDVFEYEYESVPEVIVENELSAAAGCFKLFLVIGLVIILGTIAWIFLR